MYVYSLSQWLLFFYVYCFFGWIFESGFVSIRKKRFVNRGFMHGPFLPLYGFGAILALIVTIPVRGNYVLMYLFGAVAATILEYVTGVVMEAVFKVRYWDYSNQKFNFQGHVCLSSTIAWGFLVIFLVEVVQQPIERMILSIHGIWQEILVYVLTFYFVADFTLAFKEAVELRDLLLYVERAKDDVERMKKRLDVVIAVADEELSQKKELLKERQQLYAEALEDRKEQYKNCLSGHNLNLAKRFFSAHPTAYSERFSGALAELKENVKNLKKEK